MDDGGYYTERQEYIPYDEGEDFYGNGDTAMAIVQGAQPSNNSDDYSLKNSDSSTSHKPAFTNIKRDEQHRSQSAQPGSATPRSGSTSLNDRAAELRAKLLATKRGSTPGTLSRFSKNVAGHAPKGNNSLKDARETFKEGLQQIQSNGQKVIKMSNGSFQPTANKNISGSLTDPQHPSSMQSDRVCDIDGLFAEARAANDARIAGPKLSQNSAEKDEDKEHRTPSNSKATAKPKPQVNIAGGKDHPSNNGSSSDASEPGEIKTDQSKQVCAPYAEPQLPRDSSHQRRISNGKPTTNTTAGSASKMHPPSQVDALSSVPKDRVLGTQVQPQDALNAQQLSRSPSASHQHDRSQISRADPKEGASKPPQLIQELPNEQQRNPIRQSGFREKDILGLDQSERQKYYERKLQTSKANVERNARAAAVYKKELEEKARRQEESRAKRQNVESITAIDMRGGRERPTSVPKANTTPEKPVDRHNDRLAQSKSLEEATRREPVVNTSKHVGESTEDLNDWLELTNYYDVQLRNDRLSLFREMRANDARRAELQRKAEQLGIRTQPIVLQENSEGSASQSIIFPNNLRASSAAAMPPPPVPLQGDQEDVGIKIKNSANRENPLSPRKLKRPHVEDNLGSRHGQNKLLRLESHVQSGQPRSQRSPVGRGRMPITDQFSTNDRDYPMEFRDRSRSPQPRRRMITPEPRITEPAVSPTRFETEGTRSEREFHEDISILRDNGAKPSYEENNYSNEYNPRWNSYRPNTHHHQNMSLNNHQGRSRGGRSGYQTNIRGSYTPYTPGGQANEGERLSSASLNLQAGGQLNLQKTKACPH